MDNRTIVLQCMVYKEKDDDMYTSICLDLNVASCGDTIEEAKKYLGEAIKSYLEYAVEHNKIDELVLSKVGKHKSLPKKREATPFRPKIKLSSGVIAYC